MVSPSAQVLFVDAVAVVRSHLAPAVGVAVVSKIPADRPASFVLLERTGGTVSGGGVVDLAQITVDCWAQTKPEAAGLAQRVRRLLHAMGESVIDGVTVGQVSEFSGPADFPDIDSLSPRMRQSFRIPVRGSSELGETDGQ